MSSRQFLHVRLRTRGACKPVVARSPCSSSARAARRPFLLRAARHGRLGPDVADRDCVPSGAAASSSRATVAAGAPWTTKSARDPVTTVSACLTSLAWTSRFSIAAVARRECARVGCNARLISQECEA